MKTQTQHTPTSYGYRIGRVKGNGQYVVGKDNSETEIFYFDTAKEAINKFAEIVGEDFTVRAINVHDELVDTARGILGWLTAEEHAVDQGRISMPRLDVVRAEIARLEAVLAKAEGVKP